MPHKSIQNNMTEKTIKYMNLILTIIIYNCYNLHYKCYNSRPFVHYYVFHIKPFYVEQFYPEHFELFHRWKPYSDIVLVLQASNKKDLKVLGIFIFVGKND